MSEQGVGMKGGRDQPTQNKRNPDLTADDKLNILKHRRRLGELPEQGKDVEGESLLMVTFEDDSNKGCQGLGEWFCEKGGGFFEMITIHQPTSFRVNWEAAATMRQEMRLTREAGPLRNGMAG